MTVEFKAESLRVSANKSLQSLESLSDLLSAAENMCQTGNSPENLPRIQRQVLLDSFAVKKFHRDYKEWEHSQEDAFINNEIKPYNKKVAEVSRVYAEIQASQKMCEELRRKTSVHEFDFSIETLKKFDNGALLDRIMKNEDGEYLKRISTTQLFSIDANSPLPPPSFPVFNRLVNLEYRLRSLSNIKYEVLLRAKTQSMAKTDQWAARDLSLNLFLTRDFAKMVDDIQKIKTSEHEDLKYYDDYDDNDDNDFDDGEEYDGEGNREDSEEEVIWEENREGDGEGDMEEDMEEDREENMKYSNNEDADNDRNESENEFLNDHRDNAEEIEEIKDVEPSNSENSKTPEFYDIIEEHIDTSNPDENIDEDETPIAEYAEQKRETKKFRSFSQEQVSKENTQDRDAEVESEAHNLIHSSSQTVEYIELD